MAIFTSSTRDIPTTAAVPRHVAIIMDGNGRWAKKRCLPRFAGHRQGVETVRDTIKYCLEAGIEYLTLFAFSSENWRRPEEEVSLLMQLFMRALQQEVSKLERNGVRLKVVGDLSPFERDLQSLILASEQQTAVNDKLTLTIAANYGGRWDILQAVNRMVLAHPEKKGVWAESYFTDPLWPEFDSTAFAAAISSYQQRERRFGRTSEQLIRGSLSVVNADHSPENAGLVRPANLKINA